jgi:hypothetical protein
MVLPSYENPGRQTLREMTNRAPYVNHCAAGDTRSWGWAISHGSSASPSYASVSDL